MGIQIKETNQRMLKWIEMIEKEETEKREIKNQKQLLKEKEEAKRREIKEDSLMKHIEDVIPERSTTSKIEDPFS